MFFSYQGQREDWCAHLVLELIAVFHELALIAFELVLLGSGVLLDVAELIVLRFDFLPHRLLSLSQPQ